MKITDTYVLQKDIWKCATHSKPFTAVRQFLMTYIGKPVQPTENGKLHVPEEQTVVKMG